MMLESSRTQLPCWFLSSVGNARGQRAACSQTQSVGQGQRRDVQGQTFYLSPQPWELDSSHVGVHFSSLIYDVIHVFPCVYFLTQGRHSLCLWVGLVSNWQFAPSQAVWSSSLGLPITPTPTPPTGVGLAKDAFWSGDDLCLSWE